MHKKLTWAVKETRLTLVTRQATQVKSEELIDKVQNEIAQLVEQLNTNHAQGDASRQTVDKK